MSGLSHIDRGLEGFEETLLYQHNTLIAKLADSSVDDCLLFSEPQSIYTVGRSVEPQEVTCAAAKEVKWLEINRGGRATYHGPGQLVIYPVLDLNRHGKDVDVYLRKLESAIIRVLNNLSIAAETRVGLTGVWAKSAEGSFVKLASIGVGIKKWVTYHGIALNLNPDLEFFKAISPCGGSGNDVGRVVDFLQGKLPEREEIIQMIIGAFVEEFRFKRVRKLPKKVVLRPSWLKATYLSEQGFEETQKVVKDNTLVTVCEEARCPNIGECWSHGTATFMIMGELCTRRCNFCSVKDGTVSELQPLDAFEPLHVARATEKLGLKHVVVTSVNRDDLHDMGAAHFDQTVRAIKHANPECKIELLIPDMRGNRNNLQEILSSGAVDVLNHNVETVPGLYRKVRPGAKFERSLNILRWAKEIHPQIKTKSGVMVGLGEKRKEVLLLMDELAAVGVDVMTIGQYLQPSDKQLPVYEYVTPERFADYHGEGLARGFAFVESGPFVRSSYHAWKHAEPASKLEDQSVLETAVAI